MRYRKRPVIIEAFQMTRERRDDNRDWPEWLNQAWNLDFAIPGAISPAWFAYALPAESVDERIVIRTLEGVHIVDWNDWIIRGVKGELYPCKPDIFDVSYEAVE